MKRNHIGRVALGVVRKFAPRVVRVSDADRDLLVTVTQKDHRNGKKKDHSECALAVATKRQECAAQVIISASTAYIVTGRHATRYKVPEAASKEVVSFDRGAEFAAGDYVLKAIPKSARLGARRGSPPPHGGPRMGTAAKRFTHHTANIRDGLRAKA